MLTSLKYFLGDLNISSLPHFFLINEEFNMSLSFMSGKNLEKHIIKKAALKLPIYKGIISYLLDSTNYSLRDIALLSNIPLKMIREIYSHNQNSLTLKEELELLRLYQILLEVHAEQELLAQIAFR